MHSKTMLLSSIAFLALSAGAAAAQSAPAQVEEIVVTAQRRAENIQDVPIAITAVTAATAERLGISGAESIAQVVPGLNLTRASTSAIPILRGVGSNFPTVGFEPSVAIYVDDVYVPAGAGAVFDFNSISSIEVLKGPQGTLFGRNATGGVIHVKTLDPTATPRLKASVGYANYDTISGQFYGSTPIGDTLAINLAATGSKQKKGWGRNFITGNDVYDGWSYGFRTKLLWNPSDLTSLLLTAGYEKLRSGVGQGQRAVPGTFGYLGYSPDRAGLGYYDSSANFDSWIKNRTQSVSAKLRHDLGVASLVSITAYGDISSLSHNDSDASPVALVDVIPYSREKTFTQELQLLAPADAPIKWILGGFYMHDVTTFFGQYSGAAVAALGGGTAGSRMGTTSFSGFSQATAEILSDTNLTLGIRYTSDKRNYMIYNWSPVRGPLGPFRDRQSYSALTGRASLDHKFSENLMGYVAYNRGFKSGVYNPSVTGVGQTALPAGISGQPEALNAYTAGFKSDLADRRVRLNAEAFFYDYKNIQVFESGPTGTGTIITNGAAARIKGIDVDFTATPISNLTVAAGVSLVDAKYRSFPGGPQYFPVPPNAPLAIPPGCGLTAYPTAPPPAVAVQRRCDLGGNRMLRTPKFSSTVSASYRIPAAFGFVELAANWAHSSSYFFEPDNNPILKQHALDIINASVKVSGPDDRYSIRFWGKNLGQEKSISHVTQNATYYNKYGAAPPRTYGVTLSAEY